MSDYTFRKRSWSEPKIFDWYQHECQDLFSINASGIHQIFFPIKIFPKSIEYFWIPAHSSDPELIWKLTFVKEGRALGRNLCLELLALSTSR